MDERESKYVIGLMSGTSVDGIDVAYCKINSDLTCELLDGVVYEYPDEFRQRIFNLFNENVSVKELCQMNFLIGEYFAKAANVLIDRHGKPNIIGSHGQTIYHYPFDEEYDGLPLKSTLQIGEPAVIARRTGVMTIGDFRTADIAAGGQGAPLVCYADESWFKPLKQNFAIQNIGGMANVTVVSPNCETFAFDTGPGNVLIDYLSQKLFDKPYDKDGAFASQGQINEALLDVLMQEEYYNIVPPKTTGREYFTKQYAENILRNSDINSYDMLATVAALTAKSIAKAYEDFVYPIVPVDKVVLGGGGAYNPIIIGYLKKFLPKTIEVLTHEDFGISNNFKEAMAFALLAYANYYGLPANIPSCTGAKKRAMLGKVCYI